MKKGIIKKNKINDFALYLEGQDTCITSAKKLNDVMQVAEEMDIQITNYDNLMKSLEK